MTVSVPLAHAGKDPGQNRFNQETVASIRKLIAALGDAQTTIVTETVTITEDLATHEALTTAAHGIAGIIALLAPLASPTLTGVPAAPTAAPGTSTTQIATTAFVTAAVASGGGGGGSLDDIIMLGDIL